MKVFRKAFTLAEVPEARQYAPSPLEGEGWGEGFKKRAAFTLAEVLITLGIIGVVAAMTMPTLMSNYKKRVTEVRLQQTWSILNNAVNMAKVTHGDIEGWDFSLSAQSFVSTYLSPVLKHSNATCTPQYIGGMTSSCGMSLPNGVVLSINLFNVPNEPTVGQFMRVLADINGDDNPNQLGYDRFFFYLVQKSQQFYNVGVGNALFNVPRAGLYYDGYGANDSMLKNDVWRGCSNQQIEYVSGQTFSAQGAYCLAFIAKNNWKIPEDYPKKF